MASEVAKIVADCLVASPAAVSPVTHRPDLAYAQSLDQSDPLAPLRDQLVFPDSSTGRDPVYLAGNSLGLQPRRVRELVLEALTDWGRLGVEGHTRAKNAWLPYHELVTDSMARLVGALPSEVVVMNTLSVNLHLMLVSFYRPTPERHRILIEAGAFPSDQYAVASQVRFHGYDAEEAVLELTPRAGEATLRTEDILARIEREGPGLALVMLGNVNYLTGQAFDMRAITAAAHAVGAEVGFDLAHGAGNLHLSLHDDGPDFAVWCSYKYLNAGPGGLSGCFVHERHAQRTDLPRFEGWWGHDKASRFAMPKQFVPLAGAEGWQLSNPPILQLAALRASLELFDRATMPALRAKSVHITGYLEYLLDQLPAGACTIVTPRDPEQRGTQLSLRLRGDFRNALGFFEERGVVADFREPDIVRAAPVPLYTRYADVHHFVDVVRAFVA